MVNSPPGSKAVTFLNSEVNKTLLVPRSAWNAFSRTLRVPFAAERRSVGIPRGAWNENVTALRSRGDCFVVALLAMTSDVKIER